MLTGVVSGIKLYHKDMDHSFSTLAKFSVKLIFVIPSHLRIYHCTILKNVKSP